MNLRGCSVLLALASAGCMDCSIEAYVGEFFDDHDAIDCQFAHRFYGSGQEIVGREQVRGCILDAISNRRAFVGGYVLGGIDSSSTYAYMGTASGRVELLREYQFGERRLSRTKCTALVSTSDTTESIGLDCVGENLEPLCSE